VNGTAPTQPPRRPGWLWYGVLAAPLAWATVIGAGYFLQDAGCPPASSGDIGGVSVSAISVAVVIICALIAAVGALVALREIRLTTSTEDRRGRAQFMAVAGLLGSLLFLLAIVLSGIAFIPLSSCSAG
jgi:hypothetical protein